MADPVFILGGWQSDFAERAPDDGLYHLLEDATLGALATTGLAPGDVEVAHVGNLAGELLCFQAQLGGFIASVDPAFSRLPSAPRSSLCIRKRCGAGRDG